MSIGEAVLQKLADREFLRDSEYEQALIGWAAETARDLLTTGSMSRAAARFPLLLATYLEDEAADLRRMLEGEFGPDDDGRDAVAAEVLTCTRWAALLREERG
jgi:hypothetical protein